MKMICSCDGDTLFDPPEKLKPYCDLYFQLMDLIMFEGDYGEEIEGIVLLTA